ncbi:MAG: SIS domain-containing protein [candidate division Zixibacteria bacterium]|nr:SIS domain-containing protein [candidate division Zixibacteria bacterium]
MMDKRKTRLALVAAAIEAMEAKMALMELATDTIIELASALTRTIKRGGTIYLAGNGGSAADCQHFATELVVRLTGKFERPSLPAVSLTSDGALLTAAGNDYGFDHIFARQVEGLVRKKDHLVLISTSGNSENLILAARAARRKGVEVSALVGGNGGKLKRLVARAVVVPSDSVQRIQEEHTFVIHNLVQLIEWNLFG